LKNNNNKMFQNTKQSTSGDNLTKEYKILLSLKPAVRLDPRLENIVLNFEEIERPKKVIVSKIEETISGSRIQSGLLLRVFLRAENLKEAMNEAKSFADGITSFITLATWCGTGNSIGKSGV
jgi:hypothetical protein